MLKFFTEKNTNLSIAINPNQVVYVLDHIEGTKVTLNDGSCHFVTEDYLIVVSRLNERD